MAIDPRFLACSGREVFIGNELLVKGALETEGGVALLTGYPGSPIAGFFDCLGDIGELLKSHGVRAYQANNEALGVAAVNGSQMAPIKLSQAAGLYIGYIVTVAHADGGGTVECKPNQWPDLNTHRKIALDTASIPVDKTVLLPPRTWRKELQTDERYRLTMERARELGINRIYPASLAPCPLPLAPLGFITTGMGRPYLEHVLTDLGLCGAFPILNMGMSYPVDVNLVAEFSKLCKSMIVIEERRSFLEHNIRDAAFKFLPHEDAADVV